MLASIAVMTDGMMTETRLLQMALGLFATFVLGLSAPRAFAKPAVTIDPIGSHYPLFVVEKNENPENVLIAYTRLDSACRVVVDPATKKPFLDYYWLMDRTRYKPVHRLIKSGIRDRLEVASSHEDGTFAIQVNDLKELQQDLGTPTLQVRAKAASKGGCEVDTTMTLGPSDQSRLLHLDSIYTESKKTFLPPFRKILAVTLKGDSTERKYRAR